MTVDQWVCKLAVERVGPRGAMKVAYLVDPKAVQMAVETV